jgi:hypothetical protein
MGVLPTLSGCIFSEKRVKYFSECPVNLALYQGKERRVSEKAISASGQRRKIFFRTSTGAAFHGWLLKDHAGHCEIMK